MKEIEDQKEGLKRLIWAAQGKAPCDLLLKNAYILDVVTGDIILGDVGIVGDKIAGIGDWYLAKEAVDLSGMYLVPGFIDAHLHVESTMLIPSRLSGYLLKNGTTTVVSDPHEIANVGGVEGVMAMMEDARGACVDFFFTAPSCVPATYNETSGAELGHEELAFLSNEKGILGLSEVMDFVSILNGKDEMLQKLSLFRTRHGHAPMLTGRSLMGYVAAGIDSDHETVSYREGLEKLKAGMFLMLREGSSAKNLKELLPLVDRHTFFRCCLVTDDLSPKDLFENGHINWVLKKAIQLGLAPIYAYRLVSICPALYLGLNDRGLIAPGKLADMVILRDLRSVEILATVKAGRFMRPEEMGEGNGGSKRFLNLTDTVNFQPFQVEDLGIPAKGDNIRVISIIPDQIITGSKVVKAKKERGFAVSDRDRDILKLVVVERHRSTGNMGKGFVEGFGLREGALASSVAHDAHNIVCVGVEDKSIHTAIHRLKEIKGGIVYAKGEQIVEELSLPYGGLMCNLELKELVMKYSRLESAVRSNGCPLNAPFMTLSFLALSVIPELKLTDRGLVDVRKGEVVDIFL